MKKGNQGLRNFQITSIITTNVIGLAVLSISQIAAVYAGVDGVMVTFLTGLISICFVIIIAMLCKRFPEMTAIEFSQIILGKVLGKIFCLLFSSYSIIVCATVLRGFADALKVLLLPKTPIELTIIAMLLVSLYSAQGGINSIARTSELFIFPIIFTLAFIIILNIKDVDLFRFKSSFNNGIKPFLEGIPNVFYMYLGYEVILLLLPFTNHKGNYLRSGVLGMIIPIILYTGIVFVSFGITGHAYQAELVYPTVLLSQRIGFLSGFIERIDIIFILFWILAIFTTLSVFYYMASITITRTIGLRNYKPFVFIIAPIVYIITLIPQNIYHIKFLNKIANDLGGLIMLSCLIMLIVSMIRKKGGKYENQ